MTARARIQPPPDELIAWSDPPPGCRVVWVDDDRAQATGEGRKCRRPFCERPAVWKFKRSNGWWHYCDWHTYGRRIEDGKVLTRRVAAVEGDEAA